MIKNRLDFKLINIALISIICFFVYQMNDLYVNFFNNIISIILPIFIGFVIAYSLHPFLIKKIPKVLSIFILIFIIISIISIILILLIPTLSKEIISLIDSIIIFIKNNNLDNALINILNNTLSLIGKYIKESAVKTINISVNIVTNLIIIIFSSIYFLIDMDKIIFKIKKYLFNKNEILYKYFKTIDIELKKYIKGFIIISIISFFEYSLIYFLIGHPNFLLIGLLSSISNLIPQFGGLIVNIIGIITGYAVSSNLGLVTLIISIILSIFDGYVINSYVYGKSNQIHPIITILSVSAGGILLGGIGVIIALPISIIIINTYKFYQENKNFIRIM